MNDMMNAIKGKSYEEILNLAKSFDDKIIKYDIKQDNGDITKLYIYCCYTESSNIIIESDEVILLGCCNTIDILDGVNVHIFADKNSDIDILCPKTSKCMLEYEDGTKFCIQKNLENMILKNKDHEC